MFSKWPLIAGIGLILALLAALGVQEYRIRGLKLDAAQTAQKQAETYAARLKAVADREHASAARAASIAGAYANEIADIHDATARIPADIRAGVLKLRDYWAGQAVVSQAGPGTADPDAAQQRRADSASRIVRAAEQCDAQVERLQQLIREDRRLCNGQ